MEWHKSSTTVGVRSGAPKSERILLRMRRPSCQSPSELVQVGVTPMEHTDKYKSAITVACVHVDIETKF